MPLNDLQKAWLANHSHNQAQVLDDDGDPIEPGGELPENVALTLEDPGQAWQANHEYGSNERINIDGNVYEGTGTSGAVEPDWNSPTVDADGTVHVDGDGDVDWYHIGVVGEFYHGLSDDAPLSQGLKEASRYRYGNHVDATEDVHGIADTSDLDTVADRNTAIATHNSDTTGVHGIADTAALPRVVRKTADESVTSSTTLQNDDDLKLALAASEVWEFECHLFWEGASAGDIKVAFTIPSGTVRWWAPESYNETAVGWSNSTVSGSATARAFEGAGSVRGLLIKGVVANGATPGDLQLQWAQNASSGTATTVYTNSTLKAYKLA